VIENIITIPVDSVLYADRGSITPVASAPVPAEFQGSACIAEVEADNQESVHLNNNLIISSGSTSGTVFDFESEAFGVTGAEIPLTLGTTVDVSLQMGPAQVSSGGVIVTIDCTRTTPPEPTAPQPTVPQPTVPQIPVPVPTTTEPQTPSTTQPTTVPPTPTTTDVVAALPPGQTPTPTSPTPALPATGPSSAPWTALAAIALLVAGSGFILLAQRPTSGTD
jgi:LPXTG-motif cell wall-anchored protein